MRRSAPRFLRCNNAFRRPLLTGNGISAGFSVLVPLAHEIGSRAAGALQKSTGGNMRKLILAAASVAALAVAGPASAQSPIVIKFSHVVATNTPKGLAAEKFKELAEKYSDGKVKVEVYPNSTLYKDKEELEALQLGAVQMLAPSNSKFGPIGIREFEVFDLPYILPDLKTLRKVTDGPLGARLLKLLDAKGMTGLAYWDNGFKQMSANKKLVTPADYRGVKFRIQSSKVLEAQFRSLGSIPQVMAFSEVYQALKTGKSEIISLTPEQDAAMRKAMEPVYKDVASRVGQPLIDEFLKETRGATN